MGRDESFYTRMGKLSAIIMILPASMAAGWVAGYFLLDRPFNLFPWASIAFTLLGGGAGFYEIFRLLLDRRRD